MGYLSPAEYPQYGLSADTTDDWIEMASSLIDAHCRRQSLLPTQYKERFRLIAGAQSVRLSYLPLAAVSPATTPIVEARVRFGVPRRGEVPDLFREQIALAFSLPGSWSSLDATMLDLDDSTGELTIPQNFLGLNYNEIEVTYTSGLALVPPSVKFACAQVVRNAQSMPSTVVRSNKLDTMQMQYFSDSLIDAQVQMLLRPFVAQRVG